MKWLGLTCLTIASKDRTVSFFFFRFLALHWCPDSERAANARAQEDGCFSFPTPRRFRQSARTEQSFVLSLFLGDFS